MARPGYIEARQRMYRAKESVDAAELGLAEVDKPDFMASHGIPLPPNVREIHRSDRQKALERHRAEYEAASRAFQVFEKSPKAARTYYHDRFQINLAVGEELGNAIRAKLKGGVSLSSLTRDALAQYLLQNPPRPAENPWGEGEEPF